MDENGLAEAADYLRYAEHIARLGADQCYPVLYERREEVADVLRNMALDPMCDQNQQKLWQIAHWDRTTWLIYAGRADYYCF